MASTLVFPDGVRLAQWDEIPGPEPYRRELWAKVESAEIRAGYTLKQTSNGPSPYFSEANVDAPQIWKVFHELCQYLLGPTSTLLLGDSDDKPTHVGSADTSVLISLLTPYQYQLAHDGWIQFGLIDLHSERVSEVFVSPTKHFSIWLHDKYQFQSIMKRHNIVEENALEFLDEYPRITSRLLEDKVFFNDAAEFIEYFDSKISSLL